MSIAVRHPRYGTRQTRPVSAVGALVCTTVLLSGAAFAAGRASTPAQPLTDAIRTIDAIPLSTRQSAAGALAAADNAVTVGYSSIIGDPTRDATLIENAYAPRVRASALNGAAEVRAQNPAARLLWVHGGHDLSLIGARRLDSFDGAHAEVSTWSANVIWGPGRPPEQSWVLTRTELAWSGAHWLVTGTTTLPAAGPVPALTPQASRGNDTGVAFNTRLAGFTAPVYWAGG